MVAPPSRILSAIAGLVVALSLAAWAVAGAWGVQPRAHAASTCHISANEGEDLGPTYVTYIGVSGGASCAQAKKLVRSYYQCRVKHGGKFDEGKLGHCSGVEGFHCTEHRYGVIKVQYDASVTCARGRETVRHNYTQFT
ncbi:MAG TPA: hypothetical protein VEJ23_07370 [Solirubrobacteraceae bacterium]|nr:hypothetical protein [Solirubrobacteraceae bacterium]